jgi:hypothetical protein
MSQYSCSQISNTTSNATTLDISTTDSCQSDPQSSLCTFDLTNSTLASESTHFNDTQSTYSEHTSDDEFISDTQISELSSLSSFESFNSCYSQSPQSSFDSSLSDDPTVETTQSDNENCDSSFLSNYSSSQPFLSSSFCHFHHSTQQ